MPATSFSRDPMAPEVRAGLLVAAVAVVALGTAGVILDIRNNEARVANVKAALLAQGYGEAEVERVWGMWPCGRQRGAFSWRTDTASGRACAGPMSAVTIQPA